MSCSVFSDKIKILLNTISDDGQPRDFRRSALQSPDISRAELASLLRRKADPARRKKTGETFWDGFMSNYIAQHANDSSEKIA
jgi:hypothetical protein